MVSRTTIADAGLVGPALGGAEDSVGSYHRHTFRRAPLKPVRVKLQRNKLWFNASKKELDMDCVAIGAGFNSDLSEADFRPASFKSAMPSRQFVGELCICRRTAAKTMSGVGIALLGVLSDHSVRGKA